MWLLRLLLFGPRRSPCVIAPAAPAGEPANTAGKSRLKDVAHFVRTSSPGDHVDDMLTSARVGVEKLLTEASFTSQREFPVVGTDRMPTPWDNSHALLDALLYRWEALA